MPSMSRPAWPAPLADDCTTQDYIHTDRYVNSTSPKTALVLCQTVTENSEWQRVMFSDGCYFVLVEEKFKLPGMDYHRTPVSFVVYVTVTVS